MPLTTASSARKAKSALVSLLLCLPLAAFAASSDNYTGMVWETHGDWHLNGSPGVLRIGETVPPGALLTADPKEGAQSTVILLPDGQRLSCECYDARLCAQGFRIPPITLPPAPVVWDMFVGVRNVLLLRPATEHAPFPPVAGRAALAANVEIVTPLTAPGEISIVSALSVLPSGRYTFAITGDAQFPLPTPAASRSLAWKAPHGEANVPVPGPGVYRIRVADPSSNPRMQIEVLVTTTDSFPKESAGLTQARQVILLWSSAHQGWALHDFLRAYLESRAGFAAQ